MGGAQFYTKHPKILKFPHSILFFWGAEKLFPTAFKKKFYNFPNKTSEGQKFALFFFFVRAVFFFSGLNLVFWRHKKKKTIKKKIFLPQVQTPPPQILGIKKLKQKPRKFPQTREKPKKKGKSFLPKKN